MDLITIKATMSSREIAQITGKRHDHVLRDCDVLNENYETLSLPKLGETPYRAENGQTYREYLLTKMQCFDLMTGYNIELRIKVNRRWEELETQQGGNYRIPQNFSEALRLAAEQAEQYEAAQKRIEEMRPKEVFTDAVSGSSSSCLIGELAKILRQNGVEIGQNRLFKWLRDNGYLGKFGERFNIPNQQYIEQGLFDLKQGVRSGNGIMHTTITPKVTGKGQVYFVNKFLNK